MTTEELNKIDKFRHSLPEPAPEVVGELVEQLRGYDKHLRVCMGWTMRASELEVSSGMQEAQLADLKAAESFLANKTKTGMFGLTSTIATLRLALTLAAKTK
jgi:hypothetical protein